MIYQEKIKKIKYGEYLNQRLESLETDNGSIWTGIDLRMLPFQTIKDEHNKQVRTEYRLVMEQNNDTKIFLEEKIAYGNTVKKETSRISREECYRILHGDIKWLNQQDNNMFSRFYFHMELNDMKPLEIHELKREILTVPGTGAVTIYQMSEQISPEKPERFLEDEILLEETENTEFITKYIRTTKELPFHLKNALTYCLN